MIKSYCELEHVEEIKTLTPDMDFRDPRVRKAVFFKLFEFHTKYKIHPGLVYLYLPLLAEHEKWDNEQRLWVAFLEGICENPCTVWAIVNTFPTLPRTEQEISLFEKWHSKYWKRLQYDIDTRYNKGHAVDQLRSYVSNLNGKSQFDFFMGFFGEACDNKQWFDLIYDKMTSDFYKFGRLTTWSYMEFIKILVPVLNYEYSSLKMDDIEGSKSHRNGMLRVLGRDDLEWWRPELNGVTSHSKDFAREVEKRAVRLTQGLKEKFKNESWAKYIGYETVESTLCCFKNCFHGRRYPNIYTDMSYDRIKKAEEVWDGAIDFSIFWDMRKENLPRYLLLEYNPDDVGLCPKKQEYFMRTGKLPMLSVLDPVFHCSWDDMYYGDNSALF